MSSPRGVQRFPAVRISRICPPGLSASSSNQAHTFVCIRCGRVDGARRQDPPGRSAMRSPIPPTPQTCTGRPTSSPRMCLP
jgi:hypothetical protein